MTRAADIPLAVQWSEGMLLTPQHFQQQALRFEELLHCHTRLLSPFHWGVTHLTYDRVLLVDGTFRILELQAVLPDGLVVSHPPADSDRGLDPEEPELELDLRPHQGVAANEPLTLYLTVPSNQSASLGPGAGLARYVSVPGAPVVDLSTGTDPQPVERLRPRLSLMAGRPPARYTRLPLLAVRAEGGKFSPTDFIEPRLAVPLESELGKLCINVVEKLREKAGYLVESLRSLATTADRSALEEGMDMLQSLVRGLPAFEALLYSGVAHPFPLYVALCNLAGQVSGVGHTPIPPVFGTRYRHDALRLCFEEVARYLRQTLDEAISDQYERIPLRLEGDVFSCYFKREWVGAETILGVLPQPRGSEMQALEWMVTCRIGSESQLRDLQSQRILGAKRRPLEFREGLATKRGMLLFELETPSPFISPDAPLMIENGKNRGPQRPVEVFLFIRRRD